MILTSYRKNAYNNLDSMNKISREFQGETKRSIGFGTFTTDVHAHNFLNKRLHYRVTDINNSKWGLQCYS